MSNGRVLPNQSETGTISYSIMVDGTEIPQTYEFLSIVTHAEVNRIPFARLVLKDGDTAKEDFEISNEEKFVPGKEIEIKMGFDGDNTSVFKGIIIKHGIKINGNQTSVLQLECRHKAVKMTIGRKNKYFLEAADGEIMEQLIGTYGLSPEVESTEVKHKEMVQYYCSDWDFLVSRAEVNGKVVLCQDDKVLVREPKFDGEAEFGLRYGETLYEFEAEMDARHQYDAVRCSAWKYSGQEILMEEGKSPAINGLGNFSEKKLAEVIGLQHLDYRHGGPLLDGELKSWGYSQLLKSHLAKVVGRAKFRGVPTLKAGNLIGLNGVGDRFNGKGYVTAVRHSLIDGELYTDAQFGKSPEWFYEEFETQDKAASGLLPGIKGLQIGKVVQLENDPDGEFRVLVRFPLIDPEAQGIWARLASLDAGNERGFVFRPEIDDEVIVGFVNDDPRHAVILGHLHSSTNPSPIEAKDDNHEKGLVTRSKMRIHFDDEKKILTIDTPAGNKVKLDEDSGEVVLEDQNSNKITMDSSGISLESSGDIILKATGDIKAEGINIQHSAQAEFKAEGSAGAEVSSSGIATFKGSLVKIN
ncbi:type VI secretion system tip protein VgrG [Negadavirga shengliensis]|uniref:Type VI secretion system tip protein VgrG n=1 Tax=Negadavirga shengliensis TaxID=1389218 RepID=A0ABV9T687_9BACT